MPGRGGGGPGRALASREEGTLTPGDCSGGGRGSAAAGHVFGAIAAPARRRKSYQVGIRSAWLQLLIGPIWRLKLRGMKKSIGT